MVKTVEAYVCEKCGLYKVGENAEGGIAKHERIPIHGGCESLDGLVVELGRETYSVFRRTEHVNRKHEILYDWTNYDQKTLKIPRKDRSEIHKRMVEDTQRMFGLIAFTAQDIISGTLHYGEDSHPTYHILTPKEFQRATKKLKRMYPELYAHTKFKRKLKMD